MTPEQRAARLEAAVKELIRIAKAGDWEGPEIPAPVGAQIAHLRVLLRPAEPLVSASWRTFAENEGRRAYRAEAAATDFAKALQKIVRTASLSVWPDPIAMRRGAREALDRHPAYRDYGEEGE